jgi:hypothetical protein
MKGRVSPGTPRRIEGPIQEVPLRKDDAQRLKTSMVDRALDAVAAVEDRSERRNAINVARTVLLGRMPASAADLTRAEGLAEAALKKLGRSGQLAQLTGEAFFALATAPEGVTPKELEAQMALLAEHLDACTKAHGESSKAKRIVRDYVEAARLRGELELQARRLGVDLERSEAWRRFDDACERYLVVLGDSNVPLSSAMRLQRTSGPLAVDSREYQCKLRPSRFAREGAAVERFLDFISKLDGDVRLLASHPSRVLFERQTLDTEDGAFARAGVKLRLRRYDDHIDCTFKAADVDRYVVADRPVDSSDRSAKTKLEEGIYAFFSRYSRQATSRQELGSKFARVADWARLFPGAADIADLDAPLVVRSDRALITRIRDLVLDFRGRQVPAMLEIARAGGPDGPVTKIEFSWKDRDVREGYRADVARCMRRFFQKLNQSSWVDMKRELASVGANASSAL